MRLKIEFEVPDDVFDHEFKQAQFTARARELAILELIRVKRLHEHEAQQMLGLTRHELVQKMEAAGIVPTEKVFGAIRNELDSAIKSAERRRRDNQPK